MWDRVSLVYLGSEDLAVPSWLLWLSRARHAFAGETSSGPLHGQIEKQYTASCSLEEKEVLLCSNTGILAELPSSPGGVLAIALSLL